MGLPSMLTSCMGPRRSYLEWDQGRECHGEQGDIDDVLLRGVPCDLPHKKAHGSQTPPLQDCQPPRCDGDCLQCGVWRAELHLLRMYWMYKEYSIVRSYLLPPM